MDELRAIEKTTAELKTIQNRLKKLLLNREWIVSYEIPRFEATLKEKERENVSLQTELQKMKCWLESQEDRLKEMQLMLDESQKEKQQYEKDNETLRSEIKGLKSDYLYRSLIAKNQFLEEKLEQLKGRFSIQEKVALGNYRDKEIIIAQYHNTLNVEIARLERRNNELETMNDELLKENIKLRK